MKTLVIQSIILFSVALIFGLLIIPVLAKFSSKLGLMDKPDARKLHLKSTPVVGGIAIVISSFLSLLLSKYLMQLVFAFPAIIGGSLLLFIIGVWDDRKNLPAIYRLLLQLLFAFAVAASGIRISSFYGFLGINEINEIWQYVLTILIITGVTNAFNLMDGIDGLAGGLAFINLVALAVLSFLLNQYAMFALLLTLCGALLAFLKNNLFPAKIFMGDGGSLMFGFLMSTIGILLIETGAHSNIISITNIILIVLSILIIPVFDSLRVYARRIQNGNSPFKADRTHLHHLFLVFGLNHKKTTYIIYALEITIVLIGFLLNQFVVFSITIFIIVVVFLIICKVLEMNNGVEKWLKIIKSMENYEA